MSKVTELIAANKGKIVAECVIRCNQCARSQALAVDDPDKAVSVALVLLWGYDPTSDAWHCPECAQHPTR